MKKKIFSICIIVALLCPLITCPAKAINVSSSGTEAYRDILTMYHTSISCNWSNCDSESPMKVGDPDNACYIFWHYERNRSLSEVGYALIDINNDGQSELFVSLFDIAGSGTFYDMYTIVNGEVIHVVSAGERDRYKLAEDYSINNNGSSSALSSSDVNYRLDSVSGKLKVNQAVIYDGWEDSENPYFYATTEYYDEETYEKIHDVLKPVSDKEAKALLEKFPRNTVLELTAFDEYDPSANAENVTNENGIVIYSDYTDLRIRKGSTITLCAGIFVNGEMIEDVSGLNFQIKNTAILKKCNTGIMNNCRFVELQGLTEGTTMVIFTDYKTGYTASVPITVYDDNYLSYTLNSVPIQNIEKYPTNVYNANGLYVDSYKYTVNDDQSAVVSFDVYNTNYSYGAVEVFDENGNMKRAALIEKMTSSNTNIKEALWDNIGYLVRDIIDRDFLSYRQESGYSRKTSVNVEIPRNGYIKISADPQDSLIVGFINSVDVLMSMASLSDDIKNFDINSKDFSEKLTKKLLMDRTYIEIIKDGNNFSKDLWKNVGKEILNTPELMGNFIDTITKNIDELNLGSVLADTASDFGWRIGENVFKHFAGPIGEVMDVLFLMGKAENLIIQQNDLIKAAGAGSIYIQNQGGGFRSCQQVKVVSEYSLPADISLSAFTVTLDPDILNSIKVSDPDIYEAMSDGICRTYNISLIKSGEETQPNGNVTVYIPISEEFKALASAGDLAEKIKIYRVEEDGGLTEMDVRISDGCFVFTTNHFSLYTVVGYDFENAEFKADEKINIPFIIGVIAVIAVAVCVIGIVIFKRKKKTF